MSVVWDPIESNGVPPEQWQFLYNVEAYHQRSLTADLMVHNHSSNNDYTTEHSSTGAKPPLRRASKNQSVLASDQNATNTSESFQSPVQGGRPLEGIATLTTQHASSEHTLHQLFAPATPPISTPSLTIPIGDAQPHSSGTPKSSRRPSGASALVGIFRKQVKEDSSPPSSPSDTYHANYASPSPTQKKRKSWLGRITPNTTTSNI